MSDNTIYCKYCGSEHIQKRGPRNGVQRYQCMNKDHPEGVTRYFSINESEVPEPSNTTSSYEEGDEYIHVIVSSPRILNEEDLRKQFQIDDSKWRITALKVKTSEGYRKDRKVSWHVENGETKEGHSEDSGKMLVVPLFHITATFERKTEEIRSKLVISELLDEIRNTPHVYPKINYSWNFVEFDDGMMYEIDMPDIHFGRLTWAAESGEDYDIKIARNTAISVLEDLLSRVKEFPISKILFPLGNDFFNVNSKTNTTVRGTPQQEDTRWSKTFTSGRKLAQEMIEMCAQVAPTEVVIITGNHDEEKMFYLGDLLSAVYENHKSITVDNSPKTRKYKLHGVNLIGFAHGYDEKLYQLPSLMALEDPEKWAASKFREFHTGDKHHKFDSVESGVVVRILRALTPADAWTVNNGFVGAVRAAESFLWHPDKGLVAQYTAIPYN